MAGENLLGMPFVGNQFAFTPLELADVPSQPTLSEITGLSNQALGETFGGVAGGAAAGLTLGPEAVPAGIGAGTMAGGVIGRLVDGNSLTATDLGELALDGLVRGAGGLVGLEVGLAVGASGSLLGFIASTTGGATLLGTKELAQIIGQALDVPIQGGVGQAPNPIGDGNGIGNGVLQTAQQVVDGTAPLSDFNTQPGQNFGPPSANTDLGNIPALVGDGLGVGTLLQGAQQVVDGTAPLSDGAGQVGGQGNTSPQTGTGETFGNDIGDGALQNLQNAPNSVLNANAQASEADLPAESLPGTSPANDSQPIGAIDQAAAQAASFDPSVANAVQQAADLVDATNQIIADGFLGNNNGNDNGNNNFGNNNFGSGNFGSGNFGSGDFGSFGSFGSFGGFGSGSPIVLDVANLLHQPDHGIKITPLSSSNTFFDMTGSGRQNLTAWAGAGNGVLFFDPTGQGQLTQEKQVVFTAWDPGAKSDMQALEDVFDTNHDGSLNASDTDFNDFFVMVTNPDGTKTAYSLAQLGITSINLNANAANIALPDGSSINGETTYTTSSSTTGTAATVTFAFDPNGQVIQTTTTVNADGSTTVANTALNADGSVAYSRILNTSANGLFKTLTNLNSGGVVTTIQTDDTVVNADGSTTETLTNYAGGTIQANGELTANGTTGSEKLNSTTTTTSANGLVVTILRDQLGGGNTTQREVDTTNADGSTSIVVSNLNPDGSASGVTTTALSADGLTRTVTNLVDGLAADSSVSVDSTVVNGTTRTETVTNSAGTTVTSKATTVTQTAANSVTRTTTSDLTDGTTLNLTSVAQTVTNASGSTTTQTDTSANGTLLDEMVTTNTPQSNGGLVTAVTTSELDGLGHFIEVGGQTTTISNAGATATKTVVDDSANGTLLSESITTSTVGSAARSVTVFGNGDGEVTHSQTVTVSGGTTTDTTENLNGDGSLISEAVAATSNGGLSKTTSVDSTGAGTAAAPIFDHIKTDVTAVSGGSSTEIVTQYGASTSNEISKTQTVVSANGLTTTVDSAFTSASLASGTWDQISTDQTTVNNDGSLTETITVTDGSGHVLETAQKNTSANRQLVIATTTLGTTNLAKTVETVTTESNGTVQDQVVNFDQHGDVINAAVTTTSADGLTKTVQSDIQGQSAAAYAASGLAFDSTATATTVINADGSRTETTNVTSRNGTLLSTASVLISANGLSVTTTENPFAAAHFATQSTDVTTLNSDGSSTETVSNYDYNAILIDRTTTTRSANGLSTTVLHDFNGDGVTDQSTTDVSTINANGSRTETVTDYTGGTNGTIRDVTTTTSGIIISGAGLETTITRQSNGSVPTYQVETIAPSANGTVTDTTQDYARAGGPLLLQTTVTTSANGLVRTVGTAVNGDTSTDFSTTDATVLNANGSRTETLSTSNKAGLISETVKITSANGLSRTTEIDANGALSGTNPVFNSVTTDNTALNGDGSRTETMTASAANGATTVQAVTTTSADQQTITTNRFLDVTGNIATVDQSEVVQTQSNGSVTDTISSFGASHNLLSTVVKTTSGNGLATSTLFENASGTAVDTQSDTTIYDSNGDGTTEIFTDSDAVVGFATSLTKRTLGNAQSTTTTLNLAGALAGAANGFYAVASDNVSIADSGVRTETIVDTINGASSPTDSTTILTSANQLVTEVLTTLGNSSAYITQQTTVGVDGSKSQVTTYFDPAALSVIEEQTTVNTSYDGRTVTTTEMSANDQGGQSFNSFTPTFGGSGYNIETNTFVENANGTTTDTRSGSGSFGATGYTQTVNVVTNADSSLTTTTLNYDASGLLVDQIVAGISPDGLVKSYAYDTTGKEPIANLNAAAADIINGAALPASLLGTDIIESDTTTLNSNGSKTEVVKTAFGNSLANQRSLTTKDTSANGLVTTLFIDNDGSGVYEEVGTITTQSDGSQTRVYNFYNNTSGTQQINSKTVGSTLVGTNTYSVSANGLVTTLTTSTGITDTTATFANANGSYEFSRSVAAGSKAASNGDKNGTASHFIDANGIDTWSWNTGSGSSGTIEIDLATEKQNIAIANEIYQTLLGHPMDEAETEYLAQFITNGVLDRESLAFSIINTTEYQTNFVLSSTQPGPIYGAFNVLAALENALGRLPTAEEMATFDQSTSSAQYGTSTASAQAFVPAAVAIAQYAMDRGNEANLTVIDPNQDLVAPAAQWINPANTALIHTSGTYSFSGFLVSVFSGTVTVNGNSNVIMAFAGSVTANGFNDIIDVNENPATVIASNASITVDDSNIATVSGNNDQIAQVGPTQLNLTSGSGDVIYITAGSLVTFFPPYTHSYSTTNASNASITLASGVGTSAAPDLVNGSSDTITLTGGDNLTLSGSNNTIKVLGSNDTIAASNATIIVASGVTGLTINGTGNNVINAPVKTTVLQTDGTTALTEVGSNFFLDNTSSGTGPELKFGGNVVIAGQFGGGGWAPIGAVQTASGYDVAWQNVGTNQFSVWQTDSGGNYVSDFGPLTSNSVTLETLETTFNQDLNGDGTVGIVANVIQIDGSTKLVQVANNYFLNPVGGGSGPELKFGGSVVIAGQFGGGWAPIGAVQTAGGYDVAWHDVATNQFSVWQTDSNGNYISDFGALTTNSFSLESLETTFNQDLNGDGTIGVVIQIDGFTKLMQVAGNYFLNPVGGGAGPELKFGGSVVTAGQFGGGWTPIGAVQTASGYDVAWHDVGTNQFSVWQTDSSGNYVSDFGALTANSATLESLETTFNQDLNSDGKVGLPGTIVQTDGTTSLMLVGSNYFLEPVGGGKTPELTFGGSVVSAGQFGGGWTPIGAVQTATGYDVAWHDVGTNQFSVWRTDSNGNYVSDFGSLTTNSATLEQLETVFNHDLNGDGKVGLPVIQTDGTTSLVQVGSNYFLEPVGGGSGLELTFGGSVVTAGQFGGGWAPIGAVQTASGYDVAWHNAGTNQYSVWQTDSGGNYISDFGFLTTNSATLEQLETVFNQDLNGDGAIGIYAVSGTTLQISSSLSGPSGSATIGTGATLELAAADSASVTFSSSTGTLKLDSPSTFNGVIFGFTGNGTLSGSDQIDLKGINFSSVQDNYANGLLTVTDGTNTAALDFNGSYALANFQFASDGSGGTILYDPPVFGQTAPQASSQIAVPTSSPIGAERPGFVPSATSSSITLESQLNQLVQALATNPTGNAALDSLIAGNAQHPNSQAPAMIGVNLH